MKLVLFGCLVFLCLTQSCNNKDSDPSTSESQTKKVKKDASINCYGFLSANDTIILKLVHVGESITGTLVYKLHEKDKNLGTIQGNMRGSVLVADYTFMSEGVKSVREVVFKKVNNSYQEGYGETVTQDDRVVFENMCYFPF